MGKNNKSGKAQANVNSSSDSADNGQHTESQAFLTVLFYCLLLIFSPIVGFFASKQYFDTCDLSVVKSNIYAAVVAVVALHVALGLYLYRASQTSSGAAPKTRKNDQQKED